MDLKSYYPSYFWISLAIKFLAQIKKIIKTVNKSIKIFFL